VQFSRKPLACRLVSLYCGAVPTFYFIIKLHIKMMKSPLPKIFLIILVCVGLVASFKQSPFSMARKILSAPIGAMRLSATHTIDGVKVEGHVRPLDNNLFVRVKSGPTKTASGLFLPDTSKDGKPYEGVVVAMGTGRVHPDTGVTMQMPVSVGDHIVYRKRDVVSVKFDDVPHQLVSADSVVLKYSVTSDEELVVSSISLDQVECPNDQVLIELPAEAGKTASGVIVSEQMPDMGKVVKVGPGKQSANGEMLSMPVEVGDLVRFREYNMGTNLKIEGKHYLVLEASEILAKIVPDN
jgi:chaperonin GroES